MMLLHFKTQMPQLTRRRGDTATRRLFSFSLLLLSVSMSLWFVLSVTAQAQSSQTLSAKDRLAAFNRVWRLVNDRYYDPKFNGVDWDAARQRYQPRVEAAASDEEFYSLLEQMTGELRDSHTRVRNPFKRRLRDRLQIISAGIQFYEVEGQPIVTGIEPSSAPANQGAQPGMRLLAVDGKSLAERLAELREMIGDSSSERAVRALTYANLLDGAPDSITTLALQDATESSPVTINAPRLIAPAPVRTFAQVLSSGFGYVQLTRWKSPAAELIRLELEKLKDTPGLILDLRGNGGGDTRTVLEVGSFFFDGKVSFGTFTRRSGNVTVLNAGRDNAPLYDKPIVILVNEASASGSEMFAAAMQDHGKATIVGEQTCGCLLAAEREKLPGGGEITISIFEYRSPRGRRIEGAGVTPDKIVPLKITDLKTRRDAALLEAETILKEKISARIKAAAVER